ncbi:PepSY domain-containing protein [Paracoccus sp. (in: a-proteobacteria)]|uniref:PepSY domain-containing protein n=1 Tax=Paracoccus sp. TaxID=267 RepID=UPI00322066EE
MTKHPGVAALLLALAAPAAAWADHDCDVPMERWQPRAAVQELARSRGWTVARIKVDDGCYEIRGRDAEDHAITVTVDPATLELIEMRIRFRD